MMRRALATTAVFALAGATLLAAPAMASASDDPPATAQSSRVAPAATLTTRYSATTRFAGVQSGEITLDTTNGIAWVADFFAITGYRIADGAEVASVPAGESTSEGQPHAALGSGGRLYVTGSYGEHLRVIDSASGIVLDDFTIPSRRSNHIAVDPASDRVFIASGGIVEVDGRTGRELTPVLPFGGGEMAVDAASNRLVAITPIRGGGANLSIVRLSDLQLLATVPTDENTTLDVVSSTGTLVVSQRNSGSIDVRDLVTGQVRTTFRVKPGAAQVEPNRDGSSVLVAEPWKAQFGPGPPPFVTEYRLTDGAELGHFPLPYNSSLAMDMAVDPSSDRMILSVGTPVIGGDLLVATRQTAPVPVYRFWSPVLRGHFYTASATERDFVIANYPTVWSFEGVAYSAFPAASSTPATVPVHRFWSARYGAHFYTIDPAERDFVIANYPTIWDYEGVAFRAYPAIPVTGTPIDAPVQVSRFWSPVFAHHFYTADRDEAMFVETAYRGIWNNEGARFAVPSY